MAKSMRNDAKKENRKRETNKKLIQQALKAGNFTRRDIAKATGLAIFEVANMFQYDRALYAEYTVMRKTLADTAADNIQDILNDKGHPQHFQASKYVLQTYKSDLDDVLEDKASETIGEIEVGGAGVSPISITFGKPKKKTNEEEE